jgi:hypothetical protein
MAEGFAIVIRGSGRTEFPLKRYQCIYYDDETCNDAGFEHRVIKDFKSKITNKKLQDGTRTK